MSPSSLYTGAQEAFDSGLRDFLPKQTPKKVLDIGCGMALYDYFLFKHYNFDKQMQLYLLDKSTNEVKNKNSFVGGGWHADGKFSFYTSLECAAEILTENTGLSENIFAIVAKDGSLDVYGYHVHHVKLSLAYSRTTFSKIGVAR